MNPTSQHKPKILFLFSDTGGGHRSAAEAIIEALHQEYPGCYETKMLDFLRQYAPPPLDKAPEFYPPLARMKDFWRLGYAWSNGPTRTQVISDVFWPYYRHAARRMLAENPCDGYVSVHPLGNGTLLRMLGDHHPPFITVVTDLASTHSFWYSHEADVIVVPTELAKNRGIENGMAAEKMKVIGLPVAERFCQPPCNREELRRQLGWPVGLPVILLVSGGDGMGPVAETAFAIDRCGLKACLVVVAGRNGKLKSALEAHAWQNPAKIYGFVREMPEFMRAADILVTKAGPGTICEAFIAGIPIILYSRVPGQEDGNVSFVVNQGAGVWAPQPEQVVAVLQYWLKNPHQRELVAAACSRLARPEASRQIARLIADNVGRSFDNAG